MTWFTHMGFGGLRGRLARLWHTAALTATHTHLWTLSSNWGSLSETRLSSVIRPITRRPLPSLRALCTGLGWPAVVGVYMDLEGTLTVRPRLDASASARMISCDGSGIDILPDSGIDITLRV